MSDRTRVIACLDCPVEIPPAAKPRARRPLRCETCRAAHARKVDKAKRARPQYRAAANQRTRRWRAANPELVREQQRAAYADNPKARRESTRRWQQRNPDHQREYYARNRDKLLENGRRWREENAEHLAELQREWAKSNRDRLRKYNASYRVEKRDQMLAWRRAYAEQNKDRLREQNKQWRAANPHKSKAANRKRYALVKGVAAESIDYLAVFEGDAWVCRLCETPVDPAAPWPDPLSPSVDHIVPFARGGAHVRSNVQTAHLVCNMRKNCDPSRKTKPPV